jgi:hypothetical protein
MFSTISALVALLRPGSRPGARTLLSAGFVGLLAVLPVGARATDVEVLKDAARIARVCIDNLPDARAIAGGFKKEGLRPEGRFGDYYFYSKRNYRIFAGGPGKLMQDKTPECMIIVDHMTVTEAQLLVLDWLKELKAGTIKKPYKDADVVVAYGGLLRGYPAVVVIYDNIDVYYARGAAVMLTVSLTKE